MSTAIMHQSALYDFGELILKKPSRSTVQSQVSAMSVGSTGVSMSAAASAAAAALEQHAALQRVNSLPAQRALAGLLDRLGRHRRLERTQSEPAPAPIPPPVAASRYKTELCRPFEEAGVCKYGDKCQFAHGMRELRNLQRHPKYKTELCRTFHSVGFCPYGPRCHFVHNAEEDRRREPSSPGGSVASLSSSGVSSGTSGYRVTSSPAFSSRSASPPTPQSPGAEEARLPVFNRLASAIAAFGDLAIA